ncbi:MAG TPA: hypothetical protein VFH68_02980 [Polyangia bacterium]|jgi:hypothetical protein|nr:hypothetical protein [Polyangia bacterium]
MTARVRARAPGLRRARAVSASAAGLLLGLALPSTPAAWALCPNCLAQQSTLTPTLKLLALFLLVPFALAAAFVLVVRRLAYRRASSVALASPPAPASPSAAPASSGGGVQAG